MLKTIFILSLALFQALANATPMSDGDAQAFIVSSRQTCFKNTRSGAAYKSLTDAQISQYCSCYSNKAASIVTNEDLKSFSVSKDASIFNRMRSESTSYCDEKAMKEWKWDFKAILKNTPSDSIDLSSFKDQYIRGFMKSCNRGGLSDGKYDVVVDKLVSKMTQDLLCKCEANKSVELLTFDKLKQVIITNDKSIIESEMKAAIDYCMGSNKIINDKQIISVGYASKCKKEYTESPGKYSTYEIDSLCACEGKRVADKFGSFKNAAAFAPEKRLAIMNEVSNYCERYAF